MDARVGSSGHMEAARVLALGKVDDRLLATATDKEIDVRVKLLERALLDFRIVITNLRTTEEHLYIARPQLARKWIQVRLVPHECADARHVWSPIGYGVGERRERLARRRGDVVRKDAMRHARPLERGGNAGDAERNRRVARARVQQIDQVTNGGYSTDAAALARCIELGTGGCTGVVHLPSNPTNSRWSVRANGGSLFTLNGVDSWLLSSRRRLAEVDTPLPHLRKNWLSRLLGGVPVPDPDDRPVRMHSYTRLVADDRL